MSAAAGCWDGEQAWRNVLAQPGSRWAAERRSRHWPATAQSRLERAVVLPEVRPGFRIGPGDRIFTIGSCFARNIERALLAQGQAVARPVLDIPGLEFRPPHSLVLLNKFTTHSMLNELRWALEPGAAFPAQSLLEEGEGWIDPQVVGDVAPAPREVVLARRPHLRAAFAGAAECDVVVLTLGLVEAWWDAQTGLYLNRAPGYRTVKRHKGRFELRLLDHAANREALEQVHALLVRHGRPGLRMVVTVSPVPMSETFTGRDVLVANAYSKATLRAVAEDFARAHPDVDYYPSWESVTLSDRRVAFQEDLHHVSDLIVDLNVRRFVDHYLLGGDRPEGAAETWRHADERLADLSGDLLAENARLRAELSRSEARLAALEERRERSLAEGLALDASGRLVGPDRRPVPLAGSLEGHAEVGEAGEETLLVSGWAVERREGAPPVTLVAFVGGVAAGHTVASLARPDVGPALGLTCASPGFSLELARPAGPLPPVRVFALGEAGARELAYHETLYRLPR